MIVRDTLPQPLWSAARMLRSAFPDGIPDTAYKAVLTLLYEHFSDRHLAQLMAHATGRDAARVLNDSHACASGKPDTAAVEAVKRLLEQHGLQAVCAEDE